MFIPNESGCSICKDGYYYEMKICLPCSENCMKCSEKGICSKCKSNFYLNPENEIECISCDKNCANDSCDSINGKCFKCKQGMYPNEQGVCISCDSNCIKENCDTINGKCSKCKEVKDVSMFWKNRTCNDGYHWHCKKCAKILKNESNSKLLKERGW
jgi:hypothetical protein